LEAGADCDLPQSPINIFFSTSEINRFGNETTGAFDGRGPLKDVGTTLRYLLKKNILIFTDTEFSAKNLTSSFTRSRFRGHGPGANKFLENIMEKLFLREQNPKTRKYKSLKITWSNDSHLKSYEIMAALIHDSMFALGSFCFVALFMLFHLRSLLLTIFAIYGILISFPAAYYFFYVVMGYRKMMLLNFVALFLIMGIGADDVFVMFDAYNQAAAVLGPRSSPGQRLRWAYLEAASAMLVTTVTTAGSFFSNCVSEVIVVRQFGFFMGTVVVLNWMHVMVIFPSFLLVYEIWWGRIWRHCCCCCHRYFPSPNFDDVDDDVNENENDEEEDGQRADEAEVDEVERRFKHETEIQATKLALQKKADHERLQNRLKRRHSNKNEKGGNGEEPTIDDPETKKDAKKSLLANVRSPIRTKAKTTGRLKLMLEKKKNTVTAKKPQKAKSILLIEEESQGHLDISQLGCVERKFNTCFSPFLYKFRCPLCLLMIGLACVGVLMVVENFTPGDAPIIFLEDRNLGRLQRIFLESGLDDLSTGDEKIARRMFPSKLFTQRNCPGVLPDGLTYCNGKGDCPYNACKGPPNTCNVERLTQMETAKLFSCNCEPLWSGYNCSLRSKPGTISIVNGNLDALPISSSLKPPTPFIQVLLFDRHDFTTQKLTLLNKGDWPVEWEVDGVGDIVDGKLLNAQSLSEWTDGTQILQIIPTKGYIPRATYLSSDGLPTPGKSTITLKVDGRNKVDNWHNKDGSQKYLRIKDITSNRPSYHLNVTKDPNFVTKYDSEIEFWAPAVGTLHSFSLYYRTSIMSTAKQVTTEVNKVHVVKFLTNQLTIKEITTIWNSVDANGNSIRSVDIISVDVEKKWPDGVTNRRTVAVSNKNINFPDTKNITISTDPLYDLSPAAKDICKITVTVCSNNLKTNMTYSYTIRREQPEKPSTPAIKSLRYVDDKLKITFARPEPNQAAKAQLNAFLPSVNVWNRNGYSTVTCPSCPSLTEIPVSTACGGQGWRSFDSSVACELTVDLKSVLIDLPQHARAYGLSIKASNGNSNRESASTPIYGKPVIERVNGTWKIFAAVWYSDQNQVPIIPTSAFVRIVNARSIKTGVVTIHKETILINIDIEKISIGTHSPLDTPKCRATNKNTNSIYAEKKATVSSTASFARVIFNGIDATASYDIECWCDSLAGTGRTNNPQFTAVAGTIYALNKDVLDHADGIQFLSYSDFGTDMTNGGVTTYVQAKINVKVRSVSLSHTVCCKLKVTCMCNIIDSNQQLNGSSTKAILYEGQNEFNNIVISNIPRGGDNSRTTCQFKCFTELIAKNVDNIPGLKTYTIRGTTATNPTNQLVPLKPPSPPKLCNNTWKYRDPVTVSQAVLNNWPTIYNLVGSTKTATLNISDLVIPMQRDHTNGNAISKYTCVLHCIGTSMCTIDSDGWVATDPLDYVSGSTPTLTVTSNVAASSTETTLTHSVTENPLFVGDTITVRGHTGNAANLAMNQKYVVKEVRSSTSQLVLTGTGMTAGTYDSGTIRAIIDDQKIGVIFHGASVNVGSKYKASCYSWGGPRSTSSLDFSNIVVGAASVAPTIKGFTQGGSTLQEFSSYYYSTRKVSFNVLITPVLHNPPIAKYECSSSAPSEKTSSIFVPTTPLYYHDNLKKCGGTDFQLIATTIDSCAQAVVKESKCSGGKGYFGFEPPARCFCCTSEAVPASAAPLGVSYYKLKDFEVKIGAGSSGFDPGPAQVSISCTASNIVGDSLPSNVITNDAVIAPLKPKTVSVSKVNDGNTEIDVAVDPVTSVSDRGGVDLTLKSCRACERFPTWCPSGVKNNKCCWSTSEVSGANAAGTLSLNGLKDSTEYVIECRSHHNKGSSPFTRAKEHVFSTESSWRSTGVVYVGAKLSSTSSSGTNSGGIVYDASALAYNVGLQKATVTVNLLNYIDDSKYEGMNILGVNCKDVTSGAVEVTKCFYPSTATMNNDCQYAVTSEPGETVENDALYTNPDLNSPTKKPWCDLSSLTPPSLEGWSSLGTCGYAPKRLDVDEYCFPTCAAGKFAHGSIRCSFDSVNKVYTLTNTFKCKDVDPLLIEGGACDITHAIESVTNNKLNFGTCPDNKQLNRMSYCVPGCRDDSIAEGTIKCSGDGQITNTFRCKRKGSIVLEPILAMNNLYEFKCKIMNKAGWSTYSTSYTNQVTPTPPQTKPVKPSITSVSSGVSQQLNVAFHETASEVTSGNPYTCKATDKTTNSIIETVDGSSSPLIFTGLTDGKSYDIECKATNNVGESDPASYPNAVVGVKPTSSGVTYTVSSQIQDGLSPESAYLNMYIAVSSSISPSIDSLTCRICLVATPNSCSVEKTSTLQPTSTSFFFSFTGMIAGSIRQVECKSSNQIGKQIDWKNVSNQITMKTRPGKPTIKDFAQHQQEVGKFTAVFAAPIEDGGEAITQYKCGVCYPTMFPYDPAADHLAGETVNNWIVKSNVTKITIDGLEVGKQYSLKCVAENAKGTSQEAISEKRIFAIEKPSKLWGGFVNSVADRTLALAGMGKVSISGMYFSYTNYRHGTITCYQCQPFDSSNDKVLINTPSSTSAPCASSMGVEPVLPSNSMTISGLAVNSEYRFQCRASNLYGWGNWSNYSFPKVITNVPPPPSVINVIPSFGSISFEISPLIDIKGSTGLLGGSINNRLYCSVSYRDPTETIWLAVPPKNIHDPYFNYSGVITTKIENGKLTRIQCSRTNDQNFWGPDSNYSNIVVPGRVLTSTIKPTQTMTALPTKSELRTAIFELLNEGCSEEEDECRQLGNNEHEYNVVIESVTYTEINFRVTVGDPVQATIFKSRIETKLQNGELLLDKLPGVSSIEALEATIESETYNSATIGKIEIWDSNNNGMLSNGLLHTFTNQSLSSFAYEVSTLNIEVRFIPLAAQAVLDITTSSTYQSTVEESSDQAPKIAKYCRTHSSDTGKEIAAKSVCSSLLQSNGEYDIESTGQYYGVGLKIRRVLPDYEAINVWVTAENGISKRQYSVHLHFAPRDCNCNKTAEYFDHNNVSRIVQPAAECNRLTGKCLCDPGYRGEDDFGNPTCNTFCPDNCGDDGNSGVKGINEHGKCGIGRCICDRGWGGASCNKMTCPDCKNCGTCTGSSNICTCPPMWEGPTCEKPVCPCKSSSHGTCATAAPGEPLKCTCKNKRLSGDDCGTYLSNPFEETVELRFVWGFSSQGKGVIVDALGKLPVRPLLSGGNLDLSSEASQLHYLDFCQSARKDPKLKVRPISEKSCWVETFKTSFLEKKVERKVGQQGLDCNAIVEKNSTQLVGGKKGKFPVPSASFTSNISSFFETTGSQFQDQMDLDPIDPSKSLMRWVVIKIRIDVNFAAEAHELKPIWTSWTNFLYEMNEKAPQSAGPAIMISSTFTKMDQKLALLGSTINGFLTSNLICLAAVLLFTGDIVISTYTMTAIVLIVLTLLGFLFGILQWTFGAIEAVGVTIFVGMSVDYCLHTAHGYAHSAEETRKGKVTEALTHLGVSILGAFITTAGATLFLFPTWIYLFYQLGVMMFANTVLAVMFSFFFLSTILMLMGPTNGCGHVINIITCKCLRTVGIEHHADAVEGDNEEEEEDWDPDSLVGQIEAEQERAHEAQQLRLQHQKVEQHDRLKQRLLKRKQSAKKKTKVLPVQEPATVPDDQNAKEEDDDGVV
jgi:hypothetical protein